jgi:hypothetical protein
VDIKELTTEFDRPVTNILQKSKSADEMSDVTGDYTVGQKY